jgi:hypothetical protein
VFSGDDGKDDDLKRCEAVPLLLSCSPFCSHSSLLVARLGCPLQCAWH